MKQIEHIGIAVKNIELSKKIFENIFNTKSTKDEYVISEDVLTTFLQIGNSKIELLSSENQDNVINKFIDKKGEGIHHIAFEVEDIYEEINRLEIEGFQFVNSIPKIGADNKLVVFLHPKSTNGCLIELCQSINLS